MKSQGFDLQPVDGDEKRQAATPDYELNLTIKFLSQAPELYFDSTGLNIISLILNVPKVLSEVGNNVFATINLAAKDIHDALVTKYGPPVSVDGPCNQVTVSTLVTNRQIMTCKAKWRGDSQMISMYWSYDPIVGKFAYFIQYQPQAKGL